MHAPRWAHRIATLGAVLLLGSACSPSEPPAIAPDGQAASTPTPGDVDAAAASGAALPDAVFLTAVDEVIAGTVYEGLVDAVPGEFLRTATLVCERLAAGQERGEVLELYLEALGAGDPTPEDARLAGALVGAAVEVHCPEQAP